VAARDRGVRDLVQVEEDVRANLFIDEPLRATFELAILTRLHADDEDPDAGRR